MSKSSSRDRTNTFQSLIHLMATRWDVQVLIIGTQQEEDQWKQSQKSPVTQTMKGLRKSLMTHSFSHSIFNTFLLRSYYLQAVAAHTCNPSSWEMEAEDQQIQVNTELQSSDPVLEITKQSENPNRSSHTYHEAGSIFYVKKARINSQRPFPDRICIATDPSCDGQGWSYLSLAMKSV